MTRPTNDPVTERARRLAERRRKREAFQQAEEEIRADRSFSRVIRRVAEESLRLQQNDYPDEGSSLSSLREAESLLQALAAGEGESEAFSAFESDSDGEHGAHTNYRSCNEIPDGPEDEESDTLQTPEPELTRLEPPETEVEHPPEPEVEEERPPTPEVEEQRPLTPEVEEERPPTPKDEEQRPLTPTDEEERPPTPPARVPTPDDDMPFQYPKYRDDPDAEAHVHAFQQTWEANHVSQRLNAAEQECSKMAEFDMTLEGPAARWHLTQDPSTITTFDALKTKFLHFFHKEVDQREMVGLFYTIRQEPTETIQQFVIRFQRMHSQLSRAPPEEETKAIFLAALREPLRTVCTVIDFRTSTVDQVIDRVREMEKSSSWLALGALQRALPTDEDLRFRQAIQCTTCLNAGHSALECTMSSQCLLCHSRSHTMERCEYNLLNRQAPPVRQIEPRSDQEEKEERWRREERYRPAQDVWYSDRRDTYDRYDRYDRHRDHNGRYERYNRDHSLGYNPRREDYGKYDDQPRQGYRHKKNFNKKRHFNKKGGHPGEPEKGAPSTQSDQGQVLTTGQQPGAGTKAESSNTRKAYCYYCRQEGHYSNQCPAKSYDKRPAVNMVVAEVADIQQVTTRSKGKATEWETQEAIRKQATEWVKKANERNAAELEQQKENAEELTGIGQPENPTWQALQECQITLPLGRLLQLVPRFTEGLKTGMTVVGTTPVISLRTCDTLGIQDWEPCSFWK